MVGADKQDENRTYRRVLTQEYDNLGQTISETKTDYHPNGDVFSSHATTMGYDGWGQLCESVRLVPSK